MKSSAMRLIVVCLLTALVAIVEVTPAPRPEWPGFRGPGMSGLAPDAKLPDRWSATDHVRWSVDVPGQGWSSPIVANGTVYLTSAISSRPFKKPTPGIYGNDYIAELRAQGLSNAEVNKRLRARDSELPEESDAIRYMVYALDAGTGALKWQREAHHGLPVGGRHRKNTYASETPSTDGERLYVSFGLNIGLFCYSLDGTLLWKRGWPPQPIYLDFGTGSSPIAHDGRVYVLQDSERESFLLALDAKTGTDIWRVPRTEKSTFNRTSSWSTPLVWTNSVRTEIVTTGHGFIQSYGLDGKELWRVARVSMPLASPVGAGDIVLVGTGAQEGDAARPFFAIKAGAAGDITLQGDATSNDYVVWSHPRASGYAPSALVHQGRVYLVHDGGTMLVLSAATGKEIYRARVGGVGHTFSASPIATANRVYFADEEGVTIVLEAGDSYKEIAQNDLGAMMLASPAVSGNALFLRTEKKLYRIGN
jgi:outer membrane protein assembly factor BamB